MKGSRLWLALALKATPATAALRLTRSCIRRKPWLSTALATSTLLTPEPTSPQGRHQRQDHDHRRHGRGGTHGRRAGHSDSREADEPRGLAFDGGGNLLIADTCDHRIRRLNAPSLTTMRTVAGGGPAGCGAGIR